MANPTILFALWLPAATAGPTQEAPPPAPEPAEPTQSAVDAEDPECDRLFGDAERRAENEQSREQRLVMVREGPSYIDIVQTGGWNVPEEMAIRGLEVLQTSADEGTAVFRVDENLGFCEPGEYEVEVDDAVGARGQILGVFDDVVLLEHGERLRYLRGRDMGKRPVFKVSWQSRFAVIAPAKSTGGSSARRKAKSRRRRRR